MESGSSLAIEEIVKECLIESFHVDPLTVSEISMKVRYRAKCS
jgi:hypothetical protein